MPTLATEGKACCERDDVYPDDDGDDLNPVVGVMARSWQRLLIQSTWTPQRLHCRALPCDDEPALRRHVRVLRGRG